MNSRIRFVKKEELTVGLDIRQRNLNQKPIVVWFTGLSGAGKTTLANGLEKKLAGLGIHTFLLDGDNVRCGLCKDLGFSPEDRKENIRRVAEVAKLFFDAATVTLCSFVSPYSEDRDYARSLFPKGGFFEVYVKSTVEECESRDTKGLYKLAREGKLTQLTGVSSPYQIPENPELIIDTQILNVQDSINRIYDLIEERIQFE